MLIKRAYGLSSERGVRVNFPSSKLLPLLGFTVVGDFGAVRLGSPGNRADVGRSEGWVRIPRSVKILLFVERSKLILRGSSHLSIYSMLENRHERNSSNVPKLTANKEELTKKQMLLVDPERGETRVPID